VSGSVNDGDKEKQERLCLYSPGPVTGLHTVLIKSFHSPKPENRALTVKGTPVHLVKE